MSWQVHISRSFIKIHLLRFYLLMDRCFRKTNCRIYALNKNIRMIFIQNWNLREIVNGIKRSCYSLKFL